MQQMLVRVQLLRTHCPFFVTQAIAILCQISQEKRGHATLLPEVFDVLHVVSFFQEQGSAVELLLREWRNTRFPSFLVFCKCAEDLKELLLPTDSNVFQEERVDDFWICEHAIFPIEMPARLDTEPALGP